MLPLGFWRLTAKVGVTSEFAFPSIHYPYFIQAFSAGVYSASLAFPRHSNLCLPILLWLRHPIYTRAGALAQNPVVHLIKESLELIEGLQGEKDKK